MIIRLYKYMEENKGINSVGFIIYRYIYKTAYFTNKNLVLNDL
jgi:hypothetical protein